MSQPKAGTRDEWLAARTALLEREKESVGDGIVYHTYSATARGVEFMMGYYGFLDRMSLGRNEGSPPQGWLRRHDEY